MGNENTIGILIAAKNEASPVINQVAADAKLASDTVSKSSQAASDASSASMKKIGQNFQETGSILTNAITLPVAGLVALSTDLAYKFDNAMELLHTSAGVPQSAIAGLSDKVLALAGPTGQAPEALAQGLYHVASAGAGIWSTAQQLDILQNAAKGADIGLANLDDTTYALTSAMASGIKGADNPQSMMGVLTAIVGAGDMKMQDLNGALSTGVLSTAATYGVSIQSLGAALATLTDNGEHADEASTRLRMTLALMSSPSSVATKQLEALGLTAENAKVSTDGMNAVFAKSGLSTTKLADDLRSPNGISVAVADLKQHLEDAGLSASESDAMLAKAFGGGRTDAALMTLLQNTDRMDSKFKSINDNATTMQKKMNDLNETPQQKMRDAWSSMQASMIKIGQDLLPPISKLLGGVATDVAGLVKWWGTLDGTQKTAIEWLVGMLAIGGPLLKGTGAVIKDVQTISSTFSGVMGVISKGGAMGGIATAGAMADIALVYAAVQNVISAINAMNGLKAANANNSQTGSELRVAADAALKAGRISKAQYAQDMSIADKTVSSPNWIDSLLTTGHFASGTNFAPGGMALVGEMGPELVQLPTGSKVNTSKQTQQMLGGGGTSLHIQNFTVNNQMDEQKMLAKIGYKLAIA
jgi:TP901 family phage tail tape measure protein